jgi:hypothetical protein
MLPFTAVDVALLVVVRTRVTSMVQERVLPSFLELTVPTYVQVTLNCPDAGMVLVAVTSMNPFSVTLAVAQFV